MQQRCYHRPSSITATSEHRRRRKAEPDCPSRPAAIMVRKAKLVKSSEQCYLAATRIVSLKKSTVQKDGDGDVFSGVFELVWSLP
jgi:hypothetical protein